MADYFVKVSSAVADKKIAANWVMGEVAANVNAVENMTYAQAPVKAEVLGEILKRLTDGTVNAKGAKKLFQLIWGGAAESVDALITNEKGVTLVTYYADCTPLFFVDTKNKAIGLAHAGWRGTVGRIGEKVIEKMTELYGTNPADIKAAIGPAISVCCYEVDYPCAEHFLNLADLDSSKFVFEKGNGKYMVDLLETNRQILTASGVKNENITVSDVCTNCNSDLLWSHRATKGHRGTMSAFMCIKED